MSGNPGSSLTAAQPHSCLRPAPWDAVALFSALLSPGPSSLQAASGGHSPTSVLGWVETRAHPPGL